MIHDLGEANLPLSQLLFDPNNYRFHDDPDFVAAQESRFPEKSVQEKAMQRLRNESLKTLKESIITNGFLPVERLVVRKYSDDPLRYLVLEGNRRLAALRWIQDDFQSGVSIPEEVQQTLEAVPVLIAPEDADPSFYQALMGIRHVSGIRPWAGYQSAKLIANLRDHSNLEAGEVAQRLGMTTQEVNRRYRAVKALEQMEKDDDYGDHARPSMYPFFHEAVTWPAVKNWLEWDDTDWRFHNEEQLAIFYDLITPTELDEGTRRPKLASREDVRQLKIVLPDDDARRVLLDPSRTLLDAVAVAKRDELSTSWLSQVAEARSALKGMSISQTKGLSEEHLEEIRKLVDVANGFLEDHKKLVSS